MLVALPSFWRVARDINHTTQLFLCVGDCVLSAHESPRGITSRVGEGGQVGKGQGTRRGVACRLDSVSSRAPSTRALRCTYVYSFGNHASFIFSSGLQRF